MAYTWIPFYKELAQKLLKFRNDRKPLVDFIYTELSKVSGKSLVDYIHMEDGSKVTDIDPFSVFAIFNRSLKRENKIGFLQKFKERLNLTTEIPSDFDGIPTVNSQRAFFFNWADKNAESIRQFWDLFESVLLEKDISNLFDQMVNKTVSQYSLTIILYWIAPDKYLSLDGRNRSYLGVLGFPDNYPNLDYSKYSKLIQDVRQKMDDHSISDSSFPELSYSAYLNTPKKKDYENKIDYNGVAYWLYSPGEQAAFWDEYYQNGIMGLGWNKVDDLRKYIELKDIISILKLKYGADNSQVKNARMLYDFAFAMKPGDIVFAKKGRSTIVGRGVVTSEYYYDANHEIQPHLRKINWTDKGEWNSESLLAMKTLTNITKDADLVKQLNEEIDNSKESKHMETTGQKYWWLKANPGFFNLSNMKVGDEKVFALKPNSSFTTDLYPTGSIYLEHYIFDKINIDVADMVIGYESTPTEQIVSLLSVSKHFPGNAFVLRKNESLSVPINMSILKTTKGLENMECIKDNKNMFTKITPNEYTILMEMIRGFNPLSNKKANEPYTERKFLEEVFVNESDFFKLRNLLLRKKNLILQGAPGVGKTFAARRLAYAIMGEKDDSRVMQVQFHQNYSYEGFVMGYKPNENGGFDMGYGVFHKFCRRASIDKEHKYFFIIDEINRGNLSKIFGELLMLIESDYRDKPIQLAYNDEMFAVPSNIYIIGMMNTADRSLAMIDYALRRRFSFFEMKPGYETPQFKEYYENKHDSQLNNLIKAVVELNKVIADDDSLGTGFCIGHSYLCNLEDGYDLESIVEYDIIPMLREYWFDNDEQFNLQADKLRNALK